MPAAGYRDDSDLDDAGSNGYYWSSSLSSGYPDSAYYLYVTFGYVDWVYYSRYNGLSVRPVCQ